MKLSPLLAKLIEALRCLPGVGPKTAQRMAFQLIERSREQGRHLAIVLQEALEKIAHCEKCRTWSETSLCGICASPQRNPALLCIVENPIDIAVIEQIGYYQGNYFVLMGRLSPLDGIGPDAIGVPALLTRLKTAPLQEVILATNPTVEGEATAHYLANLSKPYTAKISRIAHGVPIGSELEYIDNGTLSHAFLGRTEIGKGK